MKISTVKRLYHGTDKEFDTFDFTKAKKFKDFGKGYYLTTDFRQAQKWAQRKGDRTKKAYIYCYDMDDVQYDSLNILELLEYDKTWLEFICRCRMEGLDDKKYDIIYDRIADNQFLQISDTLQEYREHILTAEDAINKIYWKDTTADQYCFKSEKALELLKKRSVIIQYKVSGKWIQEKLGD